MEIVTDVAASNWVSGRISTVIRSEGGAEGPTWPCGQTEPKPRVARRLLPLTFGAPRLVLAPEASAHRPLLCRRWSPRRTLFPQPAVPENLLDHFGLVSLNEADDAHRRAALGTAEWVRFVTLLDQRRPSFAGFPSRGRGGRSGGSGGRGRLALGPLPAALVRIPPVIPHQMLSGVRNMLGDFGQEIQRIEYLEVARGPRGQR